MGYGVQVSYESRLAAIAAGPNGAATARAYVSALRPCYEWEGFHDCPEHEAQFADSYKAANPGQPFGEYLDLLSAHRWICAAEGYDYERKPADAARSRRSAQERLAHAQKSTMPLVRSVAGTLAARGRCFVGN